MERFRKVIHYLSARFAEPSTHASITALFVAAGVSVDDATVQAVLNTLGLVTGVLGVALSEQ